MLSIATTVSSSFRLAPQRRTDCVRLSTARTDGRARRLHGRQSTTIDDSDAGLDCGTRDALLSVANALPTAQPTWAACLRLRALCAGAPRFARTGPLQVVAAHYAGPSARRRRCTGIPARASALRVRTACTHARAAIACENGPTHAQVAAARLAAVEREGSPMPIKRVALACSARA